MTVEQNCDNGSQELKNKINRISSKTFEIEQRVLTVENKIDDIYNAVVGDKMRKGIREEVNEHSDFIEDQKKRNSQFKGAYLTLGGAGTFLGLWKLLTILFKGGA